MTTRKLLQNPAHGCNEVRPYWASATLSTVTTPVVIVLLVLLIIIIIIIIIVVVISRPDSAVDKATFLFAIIFTVAFGVMQLFFLYVLGPFPPG